MRHVATSTARNAHFGKKLRAALEDRHLALAVRARTSDRSEKSRCAATHDYALLPPNGLSLYRSRQKHVIKLRSEPHPTSKSTEESTRWRRDITLSLVLLCVAGADLSYYRRCA